MRVEWTSYSSPIGALTVVECEAGPLVIEFPTRAVTIKWAVRLRAAVPELHISQGSCRITTTWLDDYFTGSATPFPYPDSFEALVRPLPRPDRRLQDSTQDPARRDPFLRRRGSGHQAASPPDRVAGGGQPPRDPDSMPPGRGQGRWPGRLWRRLGQEALAAGSRVAGGRGGVEVGQDRWTSPTHATVHPSARLLTKPFPSMTLSLCNARCLPFIFDAGRPPDTWSGRPFLGLLTRPYRLGAFPRSPRAPFSRGCSNGEGHGQVVQ